MTRYSLAACLLCLLSSAQATQLDCASHGPLELVLPTHAALDVQLAPAAPPAWLWIEETGQDLRIHAPDVSDTRSIQVPPRFGLSLLRIDRPQTLSIERLLDNATAARVSVGLECQSPAPELLEWLTQADELARHLAGGLGSLRGQAIPPALTTLITNAPTPRWHAFALHLRAQWLLLAGESADSAPAFIHAAAHWDLVGGLQQAAVARVAAAENLRLAGRGDQALALSRISSAAPDASHYFGIRLEAARCGALFDAGELSAAAICYDWVRQAYGALGEALEVANVAIQHADLLRRLNDHAGARSTVLAALATLHGPQSQPVLGRAQLSLAETAAQQGDLPEVLLRLHAAYENFEASGEARWQSHVLRRLAVTLLELGSLDDAQLALDAAMARLDPTHAPTPYASGQILQARLLRSRGFTTQAVDLIESAISHAEAAHQRELLNLGLLELAASHLELDDPAAVHEALGRLEEPSPREQARKDHLWALSSPNAARSAPTWSSLSAVLERSPFIAEASAAAARSLSERIDIQRDIARATAAAGNADAAQRALLQSASLLAAARAESGNPLLGQALEGLILRLRSTAIELLIQQESHGIDLGTTPEAEDLVLQWLQLTLPLTGTGPTGEWSRLDSELGRLLLGEPTGQHPRALLAALTPWTPTATARAPVDLRASLDAQPDLLILLEGERRALRIDWKPSGTRWRVIADLAALQQSMQRLGTLARSPSEPVQTLHTAASELAAHLLFEAGAHPSGDIDVLAEGLALQVEWSLLPGRDDNFLGASHRIRLLQPSHATSAPDTREAVQLLQAAQWQNTDVTGDTRSGIHLPALQAAAAEADLIRSALPGRGLDLRPLASRETLLDAMARAGAWVHVSAHGHLQAGLLAGSGLWLNPAEAGTRPQFMSALDIRRQGAQARHVVLNACQLAASTAPSQSLPASQASFAHSLVLAGAEHVVAARWPVSDTATHLWVPAYYEALQRQSEEGRALDPSAALLEARRTLQRSRAFRHPFHWAAWVHLQRMPLRASNASAAHATNDLAKPASALATPAS